MNINDPKEPVADLPLAQYLARISWQSPRQSMEHFHHPIIDD
jgi:hypothetical protein